MILTVTLNSTIDRVIFIDSFQPGGVMRTTNELTSVGGKGLDASVALRTFEVETVALGFYAGKTGDELLNLLDSYGIKQDLIRVNGKTRVSNVIVEKAHHRHSHIIVGELQVSANHLRELEKKIRTWCERANWIIVAGSIPPSIENRVYLNIRRWVLESGAKCLFDCSGTPALALLDEPPDILKMNWNEFNNTFNCESLSLDELFDKDLEIKARYKLPNLVITCGKYGSLATTEEGNYLVKSPEQTVVNAAGAGDAFSGVLAFRLDIGNSWKTALKWASAASSAVVLSPGTADCDLEDIKKIYELTEIKES
ncbi:MAG: hexose kinase [Anaerolineaceae bacterium]|nr:hexose kinase [Anaerolineaceae bacterium]